METTLIAWPATGDLAQTIAAMDQRIALSMPGLLDRLFELAHGVVRTQKPDDPDVYTRIPDRKVAEYLINRLLDPPTAKPKAAAPAEDPRERRPDFDTLRNMDPEELVRLYQKEIGAL